MFRDLHRAATEHAARFGTPPPELIVEMREPTYDIAPLELGPLSPPSRAGGMYNDSGRGDFAVRSDRTSVRVGWQVGPRFGRGYDADLETHQDGHLTLGTTRPIWAS